MKGKAMKNKKPALVAMVAERGSQVLLQRPPNALTTSELMAQTGKSRTMIQHILRDLMAEGKVERIKVSKPGGYDVCYIAVEK